MRFVVVFVFAIQIAFGKRNLEYFRQFYLCFIDLEIVNTRVHNYFLAQYGFVAS